MTHEDRFAALLAQQTTAQDLAMLHGHILSRSPHGTSPHVNGVFEVVLQGIGLAYHKPLSGVNTVNATFYGQSAVTPPMHECAAWRLAHYLGPPYSDMVPVCVMRECAGEQGSLAAQALGEARRPAALAVAPTQVDAAAFFDALIGQQDRHSGNFRWDVSVGRLWLIDHGYAFARSGDAWNAGVLIDLREADGRSGLTSDEVGILNTLAADARCGGLNEILEASRMQAMRYRIDEMLISGRVIQRTPHF